MLMRFGFGILNWRDAGYTDIWPQNASSVVGVTALGTETSQRRDRANVTRYYHSRWAR